MIYVVYKSSVAGPNQLTKFYNLLVESKDIVARPAIHLANNKIDLLGCKFPLMLESPKARLYPVIFFNSEGLCCNYLIMFKYYISIMKVYRSNKLLSKAPHIEYHSSNIMWQMRKGIVCSEILLYLHE